MNDFTRLIASLKRDQKRTGTDYTGTVTKVDGGTAYVRLTGSQISDTPCALTISAKVGDRVRVRVSGGRAWVTGNDTAPPTNDVENIKVVTKNAESTASDLKRLREDFEAEPIVRYATLKNMSIPAGTHPIAFPIYCDFSGTPEAMIGMTVDGNNDEDMGGGVLYPWVPDMGVAVTEISDIAVEGHVYNNTGKTRTVSLTCIMVGKARR